MCLEELEDVLLLTREVRVQGAMPRVEWSLKRHRSLSMRGSRLRRIPRVGRRLKASQMDEARSMLNKLLTT